MSEQINYQQAIPAYSGITINITSPTLNAAPLNGYCTNPVLSDGSASQNYVTYPQADISPNGYYAQGAVAGQIPNQYNNSGQTEPPKVQSEPNNSSPQAYPVEYYMNNYNVMNTAPNNGFEQEEKAYAEVGTNYQSPENNSAPEIQVGDDLTPPQVETEPYTNQAEISDEGYENNLQTSQSIIENIEVQDAEEKDLQKNGKKVKVVALTNEYIMSLENSLNNPNTDIRLMAAKEVLTRLDEDHDRYNDAALNALINKMLQDPAKLVRISALSALSSNLASGNDYTFELLDRIQQDPNADPQDVLDVTRIMLNRSASTEIRYIPAEGEKQ